MLPNDFVEKGLELAKGLTLFGMRFEQLSRDELIAAAAHGWEAFHEKLREGRNLADI